MAVNFNNFSDGGANISDNSYIVGFANTNTGGERKWSWGNLKTIIRNLTQTYTEVETVIGSTQTGQGCFTQDTVARGAYGPSGVSYLADFLWHKADGSNERVRMENQDPLTYKPWTNFFPYKPAPAANLLYTKMTVRQGTMDTTSNEGMNYNFYVDWTKSLAFMTGIMMQHGLTQYNWVFNKGWSFNATTSPVTLLVDANSGGSYPANVNQLGEKNQTAGYQGSGPIRAQVNTTGIYALPVWNYAHAGFNETSLVSIFIENTFKY
jgi:hypothetical protein